MVPMDVTSLSLSLPGLLIVKRVERYTPIMRGKGVYSIKECVVRIAKALPVKDIFKNVAAELAPPRWSHD
jgi:hypothetical protein